MKECIWIVIVFDNCVMKTLNLSLVYVDRVFQCEKCQRNAWKAKKKTKSIEFCSRITVQLQTFELSGWALTDCILTADMFWSRCFSCFHSLILYQVQKSHEIWPLLFVGNLIFVLIILCNEFIRTTIGSFFHLRNICRKIFSYMDDLKCYRWTFKHRVYTKWRCCRYQMLSYQVKQKSKNWKWNEKPELEQAKYIDDFNRCGELLIYNVMSLKSCTVFFFVSFHFILLNCITDQYIYMCTLFAAFLWVFALFYCHSFLFLMQTMERSIKTQKK